MTVLGIGDDGNQKIKDGMEVEVDTAAKSLGLCLPAEGVRRPSPLAFGLRWHVGMRRQFSRGLWTSKTDRVSQ